MSLSGIGVSPELTEAFSQAVEGNTVRFIKVSINKDQLKLIPDGIVDSTGGSLVDDLTRQDRENVLNLEENVPAYILARDDDLGGSWLAMYYMPEDGVPQWHRMVYSTTRHTLSKSLGASLFTGSPEVSSLTAFLSSYTSFLHSKKSSSSSGDGAGAPMTAMERQMAEIRAAEREAAASGYAGSGKRQTHIGTGVGLEWAGEVEEGVRGLVEGDGGGLVLISIDTASETLVLKSPVKDVGVEGLGAALPATEPCYAFFAWPKGPRRIIFIYSCPSSSPIKHRMLYSSGSAGVFAHAKSIVSPNSSAVLASKKIETSDPKEVDEEFLRVELGLDLGGETEGGTRGGGGKEEEKKVFARPKGPGRRR